jgi:hypothetical protein
MAVIKRTVGKSGEATGTGDGRLVVSNLCSFFCWPEIISAERNSRLWCAVVVLIRRRWESYCFRGGPERPTGTVGLQRNVKHSFKCRSYWSLSWRGSLQPAALKNSFTFDRLLHPWPRKHQNRKHVLWNLQATKVSSCSCAICCCHACSVVCNVTHMT